MRSVRSGFRLEVFKHLFASVAEEMGATLGRSAFSVNIKERRDYSCAVFDASGGMIAQAAHIPVHLGSMPMSVEAAIAAHKFRPGEVVVLNDPYRGGTHLPDVTMVRAVFVRGRLRFFTACRAHFSDIGGMSPGSMPVSRDLFQEGVVIPPLPLTAEVRAMLLANLRTPRDVEGDLAAQEASCATGERRMRELVERYGVAEVLARARDLQTYAERWMVDAIRAIPRGTWTFEDALDNDGVDDARVPIRVSVRREGSRAIVDFTGSANQVHGNVNAVEAVTRSAVLYCFRCLVREDIPLNAGAARPIRVVAPAGTVVNARSPAAVTAGNVETSQRIVDVVLGALSKALPGRIPAASQGTMNNVSFGGESFAYYETIAGGCGARAGAAGASGVHSHMTNTMNTPIEAFERAMPARISRYAIRRGSGGSGRWRGGDGLVREFAFGADAQLSVIADRRETRPYGLAGGGPGKAGAAWLNGRRLKGKVNVAVRAGDVLRIETPGGGGYGRR